MIIHTISDAQIYTGVLLFCEAEVSDADSRHQKSIDAVGVISSEMDFSEEPFCPGIIIMC